MKLTLVLAIGGLMVAAPAHAEAVEVDSVRIEVDDVLALMAKIPNECGLDRSCPWCKVGDEACQLRSAGFERARDAREIAAVIAAGTSSREDAVLSAVYAAFESNNHKRARGDGGMSLGVWQMQRLAPDVAFNPTLALPVFLERAHRSMEHCGTMAEYVSGNCDHGRQKAAKRAELIARLAMQE